MVTAATGVPAPDDAPPVRLEELHGALLLHTGTSQAPALRAVTAALARSHPETVVVTSPAVTGRADLFALVAEALTRTPPARPTVRLALLGDGPDPASRIRGIRETAERLGRPVTGPLGWITVAADGTCVSVAEPVEPEHSGAYLGWHTRTENGDGRDEPPWSPKPRWPLPRAPLRPPKSGVVARPVPAGLWLLPAATPDVSGVVTVLPRESDAATLFVGGGGHPVDADDLVAAVAALRPDPATRLVLLPGALPAGTALTALAELPVRLRCAVPVRTRTGLRLAPVTPGGVVLPIGETSTPPEPIAAPRPRHTPTWEPLPPAAADPTTRTAPPVPGRRTAGGWSFLAQGAPPFGFIAAIAAVVIEVATGQHGYLVDGAPVRPGKLAELLLVAGIPARAPLLVVGPGAPAEAALLTDLATAWKATVYVPSGSAALTVTGALLAPGGFTAHPPGAAARVVGPVLPAACGGVLADLAARLAPPPSGNRREHPQTNGQHRPPEDAAIPPVPARADDVPSPGDLAAAVAWALGPHYARIAGELGAGQPDTPEGGEPAAPDPALIALHSWVGGDPIGVDAHLRTAPVEAGTPQGPWGDAPAVVAAAAALALARMPLVFGPVYTTSDRPAGNYRPGTALVEPGFVTARLTPDTPSTGGPMCVVWSTAGRRLEAGLLGDRPACVFVPGSRFHVLGTDGDAGRPAVVYLVDQATGQPFDAEALLTLLRATRAQAIHQAAAASMPAETLVVPTDSERPYALTTPG